MTKQGRAVENVMVLFVDDFINTGTMAKKCFEVLKRNNNHVDGLVWAKW